MSARYEVGEVLRVVLDPANVVQTYDTDAHIMLAVGGAARIVINPGAYGVTVERKWPVYGEPKPGEVWENDHGVRLFVIDDSGYTRLHSHTGFHFADAQHALEQVGALHRVFPPVEAPAADVDQADEPERMEGRAAIIAGLCELADFIEAHPEMPLPDTIRFGYGANWSERSDGWRTPTEAAQIDRVKAWAAAFGVEVEHHRRGDGEYGWAATRMFGAIEVGLSAITREVFVTPTEPAAVEPAPADEPEHREVRAWGGTPGGQSGVECACGAYFDGFETIGEAHDHLAAHIANPEPAPSDEDAEIEAADEREAKEETDLVVVAGPGPLVDVLEEFFTKRATASGGEPT